MLNNFKEDNKIVFEPDVHITNIRVIRILGWVIFYITVYCYLLFSKKIQFVILELFIYVHGLFRLILVCLSFFIYSHMVMIVSYIFLIFNFFLSFKIAFIYI